MTTCSALPRPTDIAFAAGLFEGEGSIGMWRRPKYKTPKMQLSMTDADSVELFARCVGMGKVHGPYARGEGRKDSTAWSVTSFEKVQALVAMFWPWLGNRRRKRATEVLLEAREQPIVQRLRIACPQGHPLSGPNLYINSRGDRACRSCLNRRSSEYGKHNRVRLSAKQRERRARIKEEAR